MKAGARSSVGLEHLPSKQRVAGSNPAGRATLAEAHSRQLSREPAAFAQALELFFHHRVLLQQLVHFLNACP